MRDTLLITLICVLSINLQAQNTAFGITYKLIGIDHATPILGDIAIDGDRLAVGAEIGYHRALTSGLDLSFPLRIGTTYAPDLNGGTTIPTRERFGYYTLDALLKAKLAGTGIIKQDALIQPYLVAGVGANYVPKFSDFGVNIPLGAGFDIRINELLSLQTQIEYRLLGNNHLVYSGGALFNIGDAPKKEEKPKEEIIPEPVDTDKDGIEDSKDNCPEVAGLAKFSGCPDTDGDGVEDSKDDCPKIAGGAAFNGCPDTDGDGVQDSKDKCPKVAGLKELNGCPDGDDDKDGVPNKTDKCPKVAGSAALNGCPDSDGDGVTDAADKCPKIAGEAVYNGCPDTDKDGVSDNLDKCPKISGEKSNAGCPVIKKEEKERLDVAVRGIKFQTGKSIVKNSSLAILDEVASLMNRYPNYFVSIEGHTDNVGNDANNMRLSETRAKACYDYLVSKGISSSRISYKGFGETQPKSSNKTPAGRAENRRVDFKLIPIK